MNDLMTRLMTLIEKNDIKSWHETFKAFSEEEKQSILKTNDYQLFHASIAYGNIPIFDEITQTIASLGGEWDMGESLNDAFDARKGEGFRKALESHKVDFIHAFLKNVEEYLYGHSFDILLEKREYISFIYGSEKLRQYVPDIFYSACFNGLSSVELVNDVVSLKEILPSLNKKAFLSATFGEKPEVITYLWNNLNEAQKAEIAQQVFPGCLINAAKIGAIKSFKAILSLLSPSQLAHCLEYEDYNTFIYSADRGNLEMIQCVWNHLADNEKVPALQASHFAAYRLADLSSHYEVMEYLESIAPEPLRDQMVGAKNDHLK